MSECDAGENIITLVVAQHFIAGDGLKMLAVLNMLSKVSSFKRLLEYCYHYYNYYYYYYYYHS